MIRLFFPVVGQPAAPLNNAEVPIPQTDLHTHVKFLYSIIALLCYHSVSLQQEKCKKFLKFKPL